MTCVNFEDDFIASGGKDGSVSVVEFKGRKKGVEPKLTKMYGVKKV